MPNTKEQSAKLQAVQDEIMAVFKKHDVFAVASFGFRVSRKEGEECDCGKLDCENKTILAGRSLSCFDKNLGLSLYCQLAEQMDEHTERNIQHLKSKAIENLGFDSDFVKGFADLLQKAAAKMDENKKEKSNETLQPEATP